MKLIEAASIGPIAVLIVYGIVFILLGACNWNRKYHNFPDAMRELNKFYVELGVLWVLCGALWTVALTL